MNQMQEYLSDAYGITDSFEHCVRINNLTCIGNDYILNADGKPSNEFRSHMCFCYIW